ncbi:potassium channel family protein [Nakamurella deserti]|uniref:potassium channel family protein n=1 Tax=Nakamurella deserti TaxID=2164074 RepID=UPI000DBE4C15|nr:potassium channel family protein [Nakamurella deserti]
MTRLQRWADRTEVPLIVVALVFLGAYAVPIVRPDLPRTVVAWCEAIVTVTWILFGVDYLVRVLLADHRWRFVRSNLFDLAVLVLPLLRPLRLLRLLALLSVLNRSTADNLRGKVVVYATGGALLLLICAGLAITDEERLAPDSTITSFGDGLWWAITTMTTVGYGDRYPVTTTGRVIAAALMVGGIALLGVVTATLASWMVQQVAEATEADQTVTKAHIDQLAARIEDLQGEIRRLAPPPPATTGAPAGPDHPGAAPASG